MSVPDPGPEAPPPPSAEPEELARALVAAAGLNGDEAPGAVEALLADPAFPRPLVRELVAKGRAGLGSGELSVVALPDLPSTAEWRTELDKLAMHDPDPLACYRIGRLFTVAGDEEKAGQLYRRLMTREAPLSLSLAVDVAEAAARAGNGALALGAIDRVAEALMHRRDRAEEEPLDPLQHDLVALGELLERARDAALLADAAPRAATLARTAVNLFERANRRDETRRALLGAVRALRAAGLSDHALGLAKRLRTNAQRDRSARDEAAALAEVAAQMLADGETPRAQALFRQAAERLEEAKELAAAAPHRRAVAELLALEGKLEQARRELADLAARAREAGQERLALELGEDELELALRLGKVGPALGAAEGLRKGWEALGEPARAAAAVVGLAHALSLAGDRERALKALSRAARDLSEPTSVAASLRVRAELAHTDGRGEEARLLLADAAREFLRAGAAARADECWLRRAELALDQGERSEAQADLEAALEGGVAARYELRTELVRARLCEDEDEREILVDELYERALVEGVLMDQALAATTRALRQRDGGDTAEALSTLKPVLAHLVELRNELPPPLRKGLKTSPLGRGPLLLAEELSS
ncbi:MAG: hypothetical protein AB7N76_36715 [Planctomycetota bacterium]